MKNYKMRTKFLFAIIPVLVLVILLTVIVGEMTRYAKESTKETLYDELYISSSNLINADRDFYQAYVAAIEMALGGKTDVAELVSEKAENYQQTTDRVTKAIDSVKGDEELYSVYTINKLNEKLGKDKSDDPMADKTLEVLYKEFMEQIELWNAANDETTAVAYFNEARDRLNAMEDIVDLHATVELGEIDESVGKQILLVTVIVVIVSIGVALLMAYVIVYIMRSTRKLNENLRELANNNLTFEVHAIPGKDEFAEMSRGIEDVKASLTSAIGSVNGAAEVLSGNITYVSEGSLRSNDGVKNINSAINEVADTSQQVADSAVTLTTKASDMDNAIVSIAESITALKDAASKIDDINRDATHGMNEVMNSSEQSVTAVNDITQQIKDTNDAVARIEECIQVITDISAQTNLLSLNASIEAARAGDAGRGFAVVAEEIRNLADSSAKSADEIRSIVNDVIEISKRTVQTADDVSTVIAKQQVDVRNTQAKFAELSTAVENNLSSIESIQQMSIGLEQVKVELIDSTSTLSAIAEELGASAEEVSATCAQVSSECETTNEMAVEMTETRKNLIEAVSVFKLQ